MVSLAVYLSPEYMLDFFSSLLYPTIIGENFQIYGVKITGKCIREAKYKFFYFYACPQAKLFPRFLGYWSQVLINPTIFAPFTLFLICCVII